MKTFNRSKITVNQFKKAYKRIRLTSPLMASKVEINVSLEDGRLRIQLNTREFKVKWSFIAFGGNRHLDTHGESDIEIFYDGTWLAYWNNNVIIPRHLSCELYHRFRGIGMREDLEYLEHIR